MTSDTPELDLAGSCELPCGGGELNQMLSIQEQQMLLNCEPSLYAFGTLFFNNKDPQISMYVCF